MYKGNYETKYRENKQRIKAPWLEQAKAGKRIRINQARGLLLSFLWGYNMEGRETRERIGGRPEGFVVVN